MPRYMQLSRRQTLLDALLASITARKVTSILELLTTRRAYLLKKKGDMRLNALHPYPTAA